MVICLERDADSHIAQLMPLPLTVSCFSKIQIGLPFWYRLTRVVQEKGPLNGCVYCFCLFVSLHHLLMNKVVQLYGGSFGGRECRFRRLSGLRMGIERSVICIRPLANPIAVAGRRAALNSRSVKISSRRAR